MFVIEISLIDGGAGEAVLDVNIDVELAEADLGLLAVGIAGDEGAAGMDRMNAEIDVRAILDKTFLLWCGGRAY